ncbi:MAG: DUF2807 domain-containing protein [Flavobacteriales bacterium]|jgi:hypothetical protein|nr:DUF2807 domain-containing protein [Flavobacteriales bacterium]
MKTIKITILAVLLGAGFTSCKKGGVFCYKNDGDSITETRSLSDFDEVALSMSSTVNIVQGPESKVTITASENVMEIIETKVKGDVLEIDVKKGKCLKGKNDIIFDVETPNLEGIIISGSGDVNVKNKLITNALDVVISGSGDVDLDSLQTNSMSTTISGSGELDVRTIAAMNHHDIVISGSGEIHAFYAEALECEVDISGSGDCNVNVINNLIATISGSGDVVYKGTPKVESTVSGSGSIRPF